MIKVEDNFTGRAPEKAEDTELPAAEPELSFSAEQLHDHATGRRAAIHEKAANMRLQWQEHTGNAEKEIGLPDDDALTVRREINVDGRTADISARSLALEEEAAAKIEGVTGIPKEAPERQNRIRRAPKNRLPSGKIARVKGSFARWQGKIRGRAGKFTPEKRDVGAGAGSRARAGNYCA